MDNTSQKLHPMIIVAAVAVTLASLTAAASFTGYLPVKPGTDSTLESSTKAAVPLAAPAPKPAVQHAAPAPRPAQPRTHSVSRGSADRVYDDGIAYERNTRPVNDSGIYAESRSNACRDCGTVQSVREVKQDGEAGWLGTIGGAALGGLLGNQVGKGRGKTAATVVGTVGGAFAGREVEKYARGTTSHEVTVRFDDGYTRSFNEPQAPAMRTGDRVRLNNGQLSLM